jgi:PAS domain S-box-containing protein
LTPPGTGATLGLRMLDQIREFFSQQGFMPHIHCYLARPSLVWTMFVTDLLIGLAYISIALSLYGLVRKIQLPFHGVFLAFGLFIFACGGTHFMEIYTLWNPAYWESASVKVITAVASIATAIALYPVKGKIVAFAEAAKISEERHIQLGDQFKRLKKAEDELRALNEDLERSVQERTGQLRKNEAQLRLITDALPALVSYVDRDHRYRFVNAAYESWLGVKKSDILGRTMPDVLGEEVFAAVSGAVERALAGEEVVLERELVFPDRTSRYISGSYTPDVGADGVVNGVVVLVRDLTAQRKVETALQRGQAQQNAIIHAMSDGVMVFDMDGRVVLANDSEARIAGYATAEEMLKDLDNFTRSFEILYPDRSPVPVDRRPLSRVMRGESVPPVELRGLRRDTGQEWFYSFSGEPIRDDAGRQILSMVITRDITRAKEAEAALLASLEAAKKAISLRDEFLSIASHELRTPITSLKLQLQMTRRSVRPEQGTMPSPEKIARVLDVSAKQVDRLTSLVEDLLDVSQIREGKLAYRFEETDLSTLVTEVAGRYAEQIRHAGCELELNVGQEAWVECDRSRVEQVVTNLVSNALKYGAGKAIILSAFADKKEGVARISVQDFGMGIAEDKKAVIFERFERAVSARNISGMGLGLYIAREIVRAHGGVIRLQSQPGQGSTFTVEIPLTQRKLS